MRILILFLLSISAALAQKPSEVTVALSKSEQAAVRELARKKVEDLKTLLNIVTFSDASEYEIGTVIKNSFLPNTNQLFINDGVIIEDDIDPQNVGIGMAVDVPVETYLRNLNLLYAKTDNPSVSFSNLIARNEQVSTRPIVKVYFTSTFNSKHNQINKPYQPTQRVAEFQIERVGKQLSVMIIHLGFAPVSEKPPIPKKPTTVAKSDSVKTQVSVVKNPSTKPIDPIRPDPKIAHYRRQGWIMVLGGLASFVGGYLVYNKFTADYQAYTSRVNTLNTEYRQWQELSRQPVGSPMTPMSLPAYAGSAGYVIYGAGAAGLGLNIAGIGKFIKARRIAKKQAASSPR